MASRGRAKRLREVARGTRDGLARSSAFLASENLNVQLSSLVGGGGEEDKGEERREEERSGRKGKRREGREGEKEEKKRRREGRGERKGQDTFDHRLRDPYCTGYTKRHR